MHYKCVYFFVKIIIFYPRVLKNIGKYVTITARTDFRSKDRICGIMKKIIEEFKKFIARGNVVDMSVGVIVGSAFTGIVNGLSNFILKPIINWLLALILGKDSLSDIHTMLLPAYMDSDVLNEAGEIIGSQKVIDLANSIYIDWGAFINAIINFFLVATVLFVIVKIVNGLRDGREKWLKMLEEGKLTREDKKILKSRGIKITDQAAIAAYIEEKRARVAAEAEAKKREEEEKARLEREANPTVEDLLKEILEELRSNK